jgi:hypothetical protein
MKMKYRIENPECDCLYDALKAGFALKGKSLERAAREAGINPQTARRIALGAHRGDDRHEIEAILLELAGVIKTKE